MTDHIKAFIAAQKAMEPARKAAENPHFSKKYADLATVQDACFPALHEHGFMVSYVDGRDDAGNEYVETRFTHESGEVFSTRIRLIVDRNNMQGMGSAITYARRYGLMNLAGIAPEDDDGNTAAKNTPTTDERMPRKPAPKDATLTKTEGETILAALAQLADWRAVDDYEQKLKENMPHAAKHPKIRVAIAERRAAIRASDPTILGDVPVDSPDDFPGDKVKA